ncbi:MAG: hypothetical protein ACE147_07750 [Candidatus Methylomirabilales bacterium]
MTSDSRWAASDIACGQCRSTNLIDLGPEHADPRCHSFVCRDCGEYFVYPPQREAAARNGTVRLRPAAEPLAPHLQEAAVACAAAVRHLGARDSLELACRRVVDVLRSIRAAADTPAAQAAFNEVCRAAEEWLEAEVTELRFPGA